MERLRHLREQVGYSQQDLADSSGVSQHTISEIELGRRRPQGRTLRKLAKALDVEVANLRGGPEPPLAKAPPPSTQPPLNGFEEERRSPLSWWAEHVRRTAGRIRSWIDEPNSPAFRDAWAAQFFVEVEERATFDLLFYHFGEGEGPLDDELVSGKEYGELLGAFEELLETLDRARDLANRMETGRAEIADLNRQRRRTAAAVEERERASARFSSRLESRGA